MEDNTHLKSQRGWKVELIWRICTLILADLVSEEDTAFGSVRPIVRLSVRLFPLYVFTNEALT